MAGELTAIPYAGVLTRYGVTEQTDGDTVIITLPDARSGIISFINSRPFAAGVVVFWFVFSHLLNPNHPIRAFDIAAGIGLVLALVLMKARGQRPVILEISPRQLIVRNLQTPEDDRRDPVITWPREGIYSAHYTANARSVFIRAHLRPMICIPMTYSERACCAVAVMLRRNLGLPELAGEEHADAAVS